MIFNKSFSLWEPRLRKVKVCTDLVFDGILPHIILEQVDSNSNCPTKKNLILNKYSLLIQNIIPALDELVLHGDIGRDNSELVCCNSP